MEPRFIGLILAICSSLFIGSSFIFTKMGLRSASAALATSSADELSNNNNGNGNRSKQRFLSSPMWWLGLSTLILGELLNFAAYTFAPAILVTPLGALSVLISSVLASIFLKEVLGPIGKLGCMQSLVGSIVIILNSPEDKPIESVEQIVEGALKPGFITYFIFVVIFTVVMIRKVVPTYGDKNILVYISICSLVGSISVMSCKFLGIAIKLSLAGNNQFNTVSSFLSILIVAVSVLTQMNYLNRALDVFSTALVTPIYYVFFTTATIVASAILFEGFDDASGSSIATVLCGFIVIFFGVYLLSYEHSLSIAAMAALSPSTAGGIGSSEDEDIYGDEQELMRRRFSSVGTTGFTESRDRKISALASTSPSILNRGGSFSSRTGVPAINAMSPLALASVSFLSTTGSSNPGVSNSSNRSFQKSNNHSNNSGIISGRRRESNGGDVVPTLSLPPPGSSNRNIGNNSMNGGHSGVGGLRGATTTATFTASSLFGSQNDYDVLTGETHLTAITGGDVRKGRRLSVSSSSMVAVDQSQITSQQQSQNNSLTTTSTTTKNNNANTSTNSPSIRRKSREPNKSQTQ